MTLSIGSVTVDCTEVAKVAGFWSAAFGLPLDPEASPYLASINRTGAELPRFLFIKVPETKTAKNRMHLDLLVEFDPPRRGGRSAGRTRSHARGRQGRVGTFVGGAHRSRRKRVLHRRQGLTSAGTATSSGSTAKPWPRSRLTGSGSRSTMCSRRARRG